MIEIACRCGKTKKNFKRDIGPFFVDQCCLDAGYDELGNRVKKDLDGKDLPTQDELNAEAAKLQDDLSPEPEDPPEETAAEKKAREKAEKKAKKDAEKAAKKAAAEAK